MGEKLFECLSRLATVLHWHGKHNETHAVVLLGRLAKASGLSEHATIDDLAEFVENVETGKHRDTPWNMAIEAALRCIVPDGNPEVARERIQALLKMDDDE